jgi:hypothetical protein
MIKYVSEELINKLKMLIMYLGHAVEQLDEALRYKSEGRGFDPP